MKQNIPKRKLSDISFENETAHIALVTKEQGHGANGHHYALLTKSNRSLSEEFIKKASQVTVTLSINEYLEKFFGIWDKGNQELLARSLGFITEGMDKFALEQQEEMIDMKEVPKAPSPWDVELGDKKLEDYLTYKLQSINVMKQLNEAESIETELANLSEEEYLQFLQDQEIVEKAFEVYETNAKKPIQKQTKKGDENMQVDMIEKSTFVDLEKSFNELKKAGGKMKERITQIRVNIVIDDALLLEIVAKKHNKPIGRILEEMLQSSPKWLSLKKQLTDFSDQLKST